MNFASYFETVKNNLINWLSDDGLKVLGIAIAAFIIIKVVNKVIKKSLRVMLAVRREAESLGEVKRQQTLERIMMGVATVSISTIALLMVLQQMGLDIGPILAGAGIVGLAVGFGGQYLIRDIITGLFIVLENQYRIGDVVNLDDTGGLVEDITLRMTTLRDLNGTVHHVPHGDIKRVANLSKTFSRVNMNIGVSYSADLDQVVTVINRVGNELALDEAWSEKIITPPQFLRVDDFGDSSIVIKIVGETQPIKQWEVSGEFRKRIKAAFDKAGIEIPFPQRVIHQATVAE
ncbi:mechanosensitive ion channel family protein [Chryseotalea sanaruensis]|uniref:Mechanosensitive ion channel family protein n=1 Tax=Chryseotalea sanaruensis TaxID=2482724 RepID=A0A401U5R3_9BACT|nr:mechanosensitive ion channel family protein [Chryseotalea sanaruensis]GCC50126.1 mechanosensitive ion channel family protein [Chryseotalea sanaruensis]